MQSAFENSREKKKIRSLLLVFIFLLLLSGVTAFPLRWEIDFLADHNEFFPSFLANWISEVAAAADKTPELMFYGTDWLAFGHCVITLFFVPVYLDPVRYKMNLTMGMVACLGVFSLAFICGPIRGIPFFHQLIDCAFGFIGFWLLLYVYKKISSLQKISSNEYNH